MQISACLGVSEEDIYVVADMGDYWQNVHVHKDPKRTRFEAVTPKSRYYECRGPQQGLSAHEWFAAVYGKFEPYMRFFKEPLELQELTYDAIRAALVARGLWQDFINE